MKKYEKKLRQMQVFYEEYAGLVGMNRDLALDLNQMLKTAGKPLACKLINGLVSHIRKDVKYINKYSSGYIPKEPQSENNVAETETPSKEVCAVATDSHLTECAADTTTAADPPQ